MIVLFNSDDGLTIQHIYNIYDIKFHHRNCSPVRDRAKAFGGDWWVYTEAAAVSDTDSSGLWSLGRHKSGFVGVKAEAMTNLFTPLTQIRETRQSNRIALKIHFAEKNFYVITFALSDAITWLESTITITCLTLFKCELRKTFCSHYLAWCSLHVSYYMCNIFLICSYNLTVLHCV